MRVRSSVRGILPFPIAGVKLQSRLTLIDLGTSLKDENKCKFPVIQSIAPESESHELVNGESLTDIPAIATEAEGKVDCPW